MTQSSAFRIEPLEQNGLRSLALTLDDAVHAMELLQQSDGMSSYWGSLVDMDHQTVFFNADSVDIEELRAAVQAALAQSH